MSKVLYRHPVTPRWRDLDAFDHVNNSNFLTYLEEARIRWFMGLDDGNVVMVWIDRASGRPMPLPDAVREIATTP